MVRKSLPFHRKTFYFVFYSYLRHANTSYSQENRKRYKEPLFDENRRNEAFTSYHMTSAIWTCLKCVSFFLRHSNNNLLKQCFFSVSSINAINYRLLDADNGSDYRSLAFLASFGRDVNGYAVARSREGDKRRVG